MKTRNLFKVLAVLSPLVFTATFSLNSLAISPEEALKPGYCLAQEEGQEDYYSISGARQDIRDGQFENCQKYVESVRLNQQKSELERETRTQRSAELKEDIEKQKQENIQSLKVSAAEAVKPAPFTNLDLNISIPEITPLSAEILASGSLTNIKRTPGLESSKIELISSEEDLVDIALDDSLMSFDEQLTTEEIANTIVPAEQIRKIATESIEVNTLTADSNEEAVQLPQTKSNTLAEITLSENNFENLADNELDRVKDLSQDNTNSIVIDEVNIKEVSAEEVTNEEVRTEDAELAANKEEIKTEDAELVADKKEEVTAEDTELASAEKQKLEAENLLADSEELNIDATSGELNTEEVEQLEGQIANTSDIVSALAGTLEGQVESTEKTEAERSLEKAKAELEEAKLALTTKEEELKSQKEEMTEKINYYEKAYCTQKNQFASLSQEFKDLKDSIKAVDETTKTPQLADLIQQLITSLNNRPQQQQQQAPMMRVQSGLDSGFERGFYAALNAGQNKASINDILQGRRYNEQPNLSNYPQDAAKFVEQQRLASRFAYDFNSSPVINGARYSMNSQNSTAHNNTVFQNLEKIQNGENVFTGQQVNPGMQTGTQVRRPTSNITPTTSIGIQ